jgi:protein gp37
MHDIWNPWHGCKKISPGCKNCYMYALDEMRGVQTPSDEVHKTGQFKYPLQKTRDKKYKIRPGERIRVNMTSDTFVEEADKWRDEMWSIIRERSDVIFWILTKRPERIQDHLPNDWGDGYPNVMLNITCENQEMFDKRIDIFLSIPAKHKGLCLAPLISDIDISRALESGQIEEVSCGGENYNNPRPCNFDWVKHIAETCQAYKVNFQWYETGTLLVLNGATLSIESKQQQSIAAWFADLNRKYYDIQFDLVHADGTPVKPFVRKFNLNHCMFCANQTMCNGCCECGKCCERVMVENEQELYAIQNARLCDIEKQ